MILRMGALAAVAAAVLAAGPAFAEVKTLELGAESYDDDSKIKFRGTADSGEGFVIQITKESSSRMLPGSMIQGLAGPGGGFTTQWTPKTVEDIFKNREGIYNVTVTAGGGADRQDKVTMLQVEYGNGKLAKYEPPVPRIIMQLEDRRVGVGEPAIVPLRLAPESVQGAEFRISDSPSLTSAVITADGKFLWTPSGSHASYVDNPYTFTIEASKGGLTETGTITVVVKKAYEAPPVTRVAQPAPEPRPAEFEVDPGRGAQHYVDRYHSEPQYREWFDANYPQYQSIYEAVGLEEPKGLAPFVEEGADPQEYVDRYHSEPSYREWFDRNYPGYSSIYEAVGLEEPMGIAPFVDPDRDPQSYVDRYNNEPSYRSWFDEAFPEYSSIYEAVGLREVSAEPGAEARSYGSCGPGTALVGETCTILAEKQYGYCGEGTSLVDEECVIGGAPAERPWWQFW